MSEWIKHDGGPCPVGVDKLVQVRMRDGAIEKVRRASYWKPCEGDRCYWTTEPNDHHNDIIAYRLVEVGQ